MTHSISHRGPDSDGYWSDQNSGVYFGHRRLAIQDLSVAGKQPMRSNSGRYTLVYNGEIYNHLELRQQLASGNKWNGSSDTETVLACIARWGVEKTLEKLNGMFAFALWDKERSSVLFARDRMGEKPLYYANVGGSLVFGSELRCIERFSETRHSLDIGALAEFFRYTNIPAPYSIYKGVFKLQPGSYKEILKTEDINANQSAYWSLADVAVRTKRIDQPYEDVKELLKQKLERSVSNRMISDVPIGAFLSGGFDSSLITALMQQHSSLPVKTFSIGFNDEAYNEAPFAKNIAAYLGTNHTEFYVDESDLLDIVPRLSSIWDEPFSDSSQIPTHLVSALTTGSVKVALSGDGGDEQFYGYNRYQNAKNIWSRIERYPQFARELLGVLSSFLSNRGTGKLPMPIRKKMRWIENLAPLYQSRNCDQLYQYMVTHLNKPERLVLNYKNEPTNASLDDNISSLIFEDRMMLSDALNYLPNTILMKVDRASMAVGLETRAPLLDHELVEFAWSLPFRYKFREGQNKRILRDVLYSNVPRHLVDRPKKGFSVPISSWLKGPLKSWADDLLDSELIKRQGYLDAHFVTRMWRQHLKGEWDWHYSLWDVLMFQSWLLEHEKNILVHTQPGAQ